MTTPGMGKRMSKFAKATKKMTRARIALMGPSGSGKTKTALLIASGLGKRIAVIDTENASASKYAGDDGVDFDVLVLESFSPERYIEAIADAETEGYDVLIIDSLSHAWAGKDGTLELVDRAAKRSQSGNSFTAWRDVTPLHNRLVDALVRCKCHLIVTMRTKTEYVLEDVTRGGKVSKQPRRVGLAPVQRDGMEYEFDIVADMTPEHDFVVSKTRYSSLDGAVVSKPNAGLGATILKWLSDGEVQPEPATVKPQPAEVPTVNFPGHPLHGKPASFIKDNNIVKFVRALQRTNADPVYLKSVIDYAATRGITDFSDKADRRANELSKAIGNEPAGAPDEDWLHQCVWPDDKLHGDIEFPDIRKWNNAERLLEYGQWVEKSQLADKQARFERVEACLKRIVDEEAARADEALGRQAQLAAEAG